MNEEDRVWPPAPKEGGKEVKAAPVRLYLTNRRLDVICGIAIGLVLGFGVFFGVGLILLTHIVDHFIQPFMNTWPLIITASLTSLACLLIWSWLRLYYRLLAKNVLWGGLLSVCCMVCLMLFIDRWLA